MRFLCTLCLGVLFVGCSGAPSRVIPEAPARNAAATAIEQFDADKDGLLSEQELAKAPGLKAGLKQGDTDQDGKLSAAEINGRIAAWANTKVARMQLVLMITRHGQPLASADVKIVPESFLGTALQAGAGQTNAQGRVMPSAPESDDKPHGLAPGYYRIEIQTANGDIPAAFNTATTLGVEMAPDSNILTAGPLRIEIP
ncbi:hypothetical protein [Anatilimnocola floriformis]|uniref:hypothetical protein n=1 Tax=Anatilimnocola floriformis TaxID=2948575 RepID=UPI0020C58405|nr:hypothetical protein [Anatilimnocola floriformis]